MTKDIYICHGCDCVFSNVTPCIVIVPGMDPPECLYPDSDDDRKAEWRPVTQGEAEEIRITLF